MKLSKFVKVQLAIFSVLTVIGLSVMGGNYVKLPAMFGIGRYGVTVQLAATGGLYETANVSYRGTNVGKVKAVTLTPAGVDAKLSIESGFKIPADVEAYVKSVSAIGEQYVDLVPADAPAGGNLHDGSVIPVERTKLPQDVGDMLDQADRLLSTVAGTKLAEVINDSFVAFNGAGPDLQRMLDSASLLVQAAKDNTAPTKDLLDKIGPLLDTQNQSAGSIREWTQDLATVTDQLRQHDPALKSILQNTPATIQTVNKTFQDLKPTLPILLANMVSVGQVGVTYHSGLEQILVIYPPLLSALLTSIRGPVEYGAMVDFMLGLNDPPGCTTGFLPADQRRSPADLSPADTPDNLFCKVAQNAKEAVRGIRNTPCMEVPGKRAPSPELCRDPNGYVPEGDNPPFGAPRPVDNNGQPIDKLLGNQSAPFIAHSDPKTGTFVGPDGRVYRQGNVNADGTPKVPSGWQDLLQEPAP
ncbi:MCE family protein [Nocardia yunnanensis]|uniref:MCE family protein n=1 Tax=Nocardia yunnanensis TaxID=2382165 RepID=A0A386Z6R3_9NOCA|nr:MlaD family protein [Nocardia yunnanensis]AYF73296.1 MCE family protein [Nocardia yunnanensis]